MKSAATTVLITALACVLAGPPAAAAERIEARPAASDGIPVATDARLGGDDNRTRFILDVSRSVELTAFTLADPYRVVVDLPQIAFQLPPRTGETGRGVVKAFRFGLVMQGGSRIVIDAAGPVRVDKSFVIESVDGQPARLVLDLVPVDRETFMRNLALESRPRRSESTRTDHDRTVKTGDTRPLVVLDPGHGGIDTGTVGLNGEPEKSLVLEFALQLRDKLDKSGKYRTAMTRTEDRFVPLAERVRLARSSQAALLISIHADALAHALTHRDPEARGATIYTLSETASDNEAARLAEAENRADVIAGVDLSAEPDDVADILIDLAQRETKSFSMHFARTLANEFKLVARMHRHPLKSAGFRVLKAPDVPSVLVELGYVTNRDDLKLLTSEGWRARATDSMVQAVHTFFTTRFAGIGAGAARD